MKKETGEFKDLSDTEKEIMALFWEREKPLMFGEMLAYFNEEQGRNWKKQTLSVFLQRLTEKEMIKSEKKGRFYEYSSCKNPSQYEQARAESFLQKQYDGSMEQFIVAFYAGKPMSKEEKDQLKQWIDDLEE